MNDLMAAMFWGGLVMAVPPVAVGIGFFIYMYRRHQEQQEQERLEATAPGTVPGQDAQGSGAVDDAERIAPA